MAAQQHPRGEQLTSAPSFEGRSAIALEHIALSLEAIEGHLGQIAAALGGQNTGKQLVTALQRINTTLSTR